MNTTTCTICSRVLGKWISLFLLWGSGLLPLQNFAYAFDSAKQQIEAKVTHSIAEELSQWQEQQAIEILSRNIEIKSPSSVKNLALCPQELMISPPKGLPFGRVQRRVSCVQLKWSLYVRAHISLTAKLPVLTSNAKRGDIISAQMLGWRKVKLEAKDKQALTQPEEIIGKQVARKIYKNRPITGNQLAEPILVKRGEPVIIEAVADGFNASVQGIALASGKKGEAIRVKNTQSGKTIIAFPIAKGRVRTRF